MADFGRKKLLKNQASQLINPEKLEPVNTNTQQEPPVTGEKQQTLPVFKPVNLPTEKDEFAPFDQQNPPAGSGFKSPFGNYPNIQSAKKKILQKRANQYRPVANVPVKSGQSPASSAQPDSGNNQQKQLIPGTYVDNYIQNQNARTNQQRPRQRAGAKNKKSPQGFFKKNFAPIAIAGTTGAAFGAAFGLPLVSYLMQIK